MFIFDASNIILKKDFSLFVESKKNALESKKRKLFEQYKILSKKSWDKNITLFEQFRDEYNGVVHGVLLDVIAYYRKFLPEKCLIVEFGSFVKRTERLFSDFDFTICYDTAKTEQYEVTEQLINYSLASIFGYSIDQVHGKFQHYPDMPEVYIYTEKDNHYRLSFQDGVIDYKCGPETLNENLMNIKNVRDYKSMIDGYEEKYTQKCNIDCLYSIRIIENTTDHDFIGDLELLEQKYDICDGYPFDLVPYELSNKFQVSEIKKILKSKGIVEFYIFISMLRKRINFCSTYSMAISELWSNPIMLSFFGQDYITQLREVFSEFIFYFNRIELSLKQRGIALSTRCYIDFTAQSMNNLLSEDWGETTSIEQIIDARNQLAIVIQKGLFLLEERG
ncbi:hypothetical protein J7547_09730 [Wohlfahrtiimonas chitiniclastica]|uniref:Nucleotidyltransferase n=1 Tax=Wohlfahrtiimonas chitiniclastica TaxID=400946 RepID=A0AB35C2L8_9GAMM|nr:hypothetical protein [Wohlfahrtiimonas chitiniclastica]MBS7825477.1 hypothetical protein [Wohlfahrtiimonas chitiniclastica]MBS7841090.1 hypothetical protein [Wohlfahrtiimonas chitiniclastica]